MVGNSWFKESHKITWYSSDWSQKSVVDYTLFNCEMKRSIIDVRAIPSVGNEFPNIERKKKYRRPANENKSVGIEREGNQERVPGTEKEEITNR